MFSLGVLLWLVYGISLRSMPMIASNSITLGLSVAILMLKLKYGRLAARKEGANES
jgi:MtN3 and saliva related transmembrane protein